MITTASTKYYGTQNSYNFCRGPATAMKRSSTKAKKILEILEFSKGKYKCRVADKTGVAWLPQTHVDRPDLITAFWQQKTKKLICDARQRGREIASLKRKNTASLKLARGAQSALRSARQSLANSLQRESDTSTRNSDTKMHLEAVSEKAEGLALQTRAHETHIEFLQRRIAELENTKTMLLPGEIIRYDAGTNLFVVRNRTTLRLETFSPETFGSNFRDATHFWLRALKSLKLPWFSV